jgi:hypothetical protein
LRNALTFTVSFSGTTVQKGEKGVATWSTAGEGQVSFEQFLDSKDIPTEWVLKGSIQGNHTAFSTTDPSSAQVLTTTDFPTDLVLIASVPCFDDMRVGVSRFGADELTYASDIGPLTVPSFFNLINRLAFEDEYNVQHQAVMAEMDDMEDGVSTQSEEIDGDHEKTEIVYTLTVDHTPQ